MYQPTINYYDNIYCIVYISCTYILQCIYTQYIPTDSICTFYHPLNSEQWTSLKHSDLGVTRVKVLRTSAYTQLFKYCKSPDPGVHTIFCICSQCQSKSKIVEVARSVSPLLNFSTSRRGHKSGSQLRHKSGSWAYIQIRMLAYIRIRTLAYNQIRMLSYIQIWILVYTQIRISAYIRIRILAYISPSPTTCCGYKGEYLSYSSQPIVQLKVYIYTVQYKYIVHSYNMSSCQSSMCRPYIQYICISFCIQQMTNKYMN